MLNSDNLEREGIILCLVGPSGSGKSTFAKQLIEQYSGSMKLSISATTRSPRKGEVDGRHYHFMDRAEFEKKISAGEFFEHEEVHGNLYGTLKSQLDEAIKNGCDVVLDIDVFGALNFKRQLGKHVVIVFISPPSREEMIKRIQQRAKLPEEELNFRLATAEREYSLLREQMKNDPGLIDYLVVNEVRETCFSNLCAIVEAEQRRLGRLLCLDVIKI